MSRIRPHGLSALAPVALAATLLLVSCLDDPSGPGIQPGFLALAPSFQSSAAGIVDVESVHVRLIRDSDGTVALDDTVAIDSESETVDLSFTVMVSSSGETFTLDLECLSPTGEVVFRAEGLTVTASTSGGDNVIAQDVPIEYVGVGSNAASVTILTIAPTVRFGDTVMLTAEVLDSTGTVIEGTPIKWISHDTARVVVPDAGQGRIVGNRARDWVHVEALLLTGPADTADVMVEPVPSAVTFVSGDGQSGTVNTELANPIVAQLDAVDGPMAGVPVEFETAGDGYFGLSSVVTDASGQASTTWTLGSAIGTQTATATVGSLVATATATASTPYDPALSFTVQPSDAVFATVIAPAIEIAALDGFGFVDEAFNGNVSVAIANNPGGGTLSGTTTVAAIGGIATFSDLTIDLAGTGYALVATATGYDPDTSLVFDITDAPPQQVYWTNASGGFWWNPANWSIGRAPTDLDTAVIDLPGTYMVTMSADEANVTVAAFSLGGTSGTQTLWSDAITFTVNGLGSVLPGGALRVGAGVVTGTGHLTNSGTIDFEEGSIDVPLDNAGSLIVSYTGTLNGALTTAPSSVIRVSGISRREGATLTIANGFTNEGLIEISQGADYGSYTNTIAVTDGTLINTGAIQSTVGLLSGTRLISADLDNQGTISVLTHSLTVNAPTSFDNNGTVTIGNGYTLFPTGATFTNTATGLIEGDGSVDATLAAGFVNFGTVSPGTTGSPAGLLVFETLPLAAQSEINIDLNGLAQGTEYDHVGVNAPLALNGTLNVTAGFSPAEGDRFTIMTFDSYTGHFSEIFLPGIGTGLDLNFELLPTSLDLEVVALPPGIDAWWIGMTSSDWTEPTNWDGGVVPDDTTSVWIRRAAPNQPVINANTSVDTLIVQSGATVELNAGAVLSVFGDLDAGGSITGTGSVAMMTSGATLAGTVHNLDVQNNVTLNGPVSVTGDADVNAGELTLGGNTMTVAFGFATRGSGVLVMTDPTDVLNTRDAGFYGGSTDTYLTAGTLNVTESFSQRSDFSTSSFVASGTHRTVFNGPGAQQQITFADYGATMSRFQELEAEGSAVVALPAFTGNGAYVAGNMTIRGSADFSPGCDRIDVAGDLVTSESGTITMTCDDAARIVVNGDADFGGGSTVGQLTAGQLIVNGSFAQYGSATSFAASGTHTTMLTSDGPTAMNIDFANPDLLAGSHFQNLVVQSETSGGAGYVLWLNTPAYVLGNATLDPRGPDIPAQVNGAGELVVSGSIGFGSGSSSINPAAIRVGGALNLTAGVTYGAGVTEFFGSGAQTIPNRTDYFTVLVTGDSVNFNGVSPTTIDGDLYITGNGLLDLDSATVNVLGGLFTQDQGRLRMDVTGFGGLDVANTVSFGGGSTANALTAGTLSIGGSFQQLDVGSDSSFLASGNHTTLFSGATTQTIDFANPDSAAGSHFNNLEMRQTDGEVTLNTPAFAVMATIMDFDIGDTDPAVLNGTGEIIVGDGFTIQSDNTGVTVEPHAVRIGDYLDNQGTFQPTVTEFFGPGTQYPPSYGNENYTDIIASGADVQFEDINMAGTLLVTGTALFRYYGYTMDIQGDMVIADAGNFSVWENTVLVGGNLQTQDDGVLSMSSTSNVTVTGNAVFGGGNTSIYLTEGTLNIAGDFTQTSGNSAQSFMPGPDLVTVLNGTAAQTVTFESPTLNESRFGDLRIDNTNAGGIVLNSAVMVRDDFLTPAIPTNTATIFGNGNTITTYSIDIDDVTFDDAPLDILYDSDYASYSQAHNVTLVNMDPTIMQIQIDRGSGIFDLSGITFSSPFTTGGYLHLDGAFWSIVVQSVTSPEPGGAVTNVNGATYCWDDGCA